MTKYPVYLFVILVYLVLYLVYHAKTWPKGPPLFVNQDLLWRHVPELYKYTNYIFLVCGYYIFDKETIGYREAWHCNCCDEFYSERRKGNTIKFIK
jgi:hypothetical protein